MDNVNTAFSNYVQSAKLLSTNNKQYFCMEALNSLLKSVNEISKLSSERMSLLDELKNIEVNKNMSYDEFLDFMLVYLEQARFGLSESLDTLNNVLKRGDDV